LHLALFAYPSDFLLSAKASNILLNQFLSDLFSAFCAHGTACCGADPEINGIRMAPGQSSALRNPEA
jgi:hypothetical protein